MGVGLVLIVDKNNEISDLVLYALGLRTKEQLLNTESADKKSADFESWSYKELCDIRIKLEKHYHDMQDLEFTIQEGKLFMLQTRSGKRTIFSWLRSQVEMVEEGLISKEESVTK